MQEIKKRVNAWETEQKQKLAIMAQGPKSYGDILKYVINEDTQARKMSAFNYKVLCFRNDGAFQLNRAIEEIYGFSQAQADRKPSGGEHAIETVDVELADGRRKKVPFGKISLPDLGEDAHIEIGYEWNTQHLIIRGQTQMKFAYMIDDVVTRTQELLRTDSVYKDQSIELDNKMQPIIMKLEAKDTNLMVLSEVTKNQLKPLLARIERPEECKRKGIPLKTGIIMEGPYGTGKTLLAFDVAKKATANNWSFIYLKDPKQLAQTMRLGKTLDQNGNGIVIFLEDVDQVAAGARDNALQDILNTLDGGDTKDMNVICIFTTNHIENINPTFLRGKRIGSIVSLGALDKATARIFLDRMFANGYDLQPEGLEAVCEEIEASKIVPAFMAEIIEKVKANMVFEDTNVVTSDLIRASLASYRAQVALASKKDEGKSPEVRLADALHEVLLGRANGETPSVMQLVTETHDACVN